MVTKPGSQSLLTGFRVYWLFVGNQGNILHRDYVGILFPCSLLRTSKFRAQSSVEA